MSVPPEPLTASDAKPAPCADRQLIERAQAGDAQAQHELLGRLSCVRSFVRRRNRQAGRPLDDADLEDVTQDILIAVWRKLETFQGYGSLEAWCYRFCVLEVRGRIRARKQSAAGEEAMPELVAKQTDGIDEEELQLVYEGLERLGPPANRVISLKLLEGWTFDRIASSLQEPPGTVRAWYYRGMRKLREMVGARAGQGEPR